MLRKPGGRSYEMNAKVKGIGLFMGVLLLLFQGGGLGPGRAAEAAEDCLPEGRTSVTFLSRPGLGHPFVKLGTDGNSPYLDPNSHQTMVFVRSLFTSLSMGPGAVAWDGEQRTATFVHGNNSLAVTIPPGTTRMSTALLNGRTYPLSSFVCNGQLYAPARAITDALGLELKWYRNNTAVVDPAWRLLKGAETKAPPRASGQSTSPASQPPRAHPDLAGTIRLSPTASCQDWPESILDLFTSPSVTTRQAALAAACRLVRMQ